MKRYLLISTFPQSGSQNIGDRLITDATQKAILTAKSGEATCDVVFRAEDYETCRKKLESADAIIFACLAIRPRMHHKQYPWIDKILDGKKPYAVVAAGTDLPVNNDRIESLYKGFSSETLNILRKINDGALFATSRGSLTQSFLEHHGCREFQFVGDIAFYDPRYSTLAFKRASPREIARIAISDPHHFRIYDRVLEKLIDEIQALFPKAQICLMQHGVGSSSLLSLVNRKRIELRQLYKEQNGLDEYENIDLHVGFRVHAHVSALKRRKYSYLLEQDGRGTDYALTFHRKLSVPCYRSTQIPFTLRDGLRCLLKTPSRGLSSVPQSSVDAVLSLIKMDLRSGFERFFGMEEELERYNDMHLRLLATL
jgi:hypothetical protein